LKLSCSLSQLHVVPIIGWVPIIGSVTLYRKQNCVLAAWSVDGARIIGDAWWLDPRVSYTQTSWTAL